MTVRTKWHKVMEYIERGHVAVYNGMGQTYAPNLSDWGCTKEQIARWWSSTATMPKFVVQPELISLAIKNTDFHLSLRDMQRAGVLRLPFPRMIVEFQMSATDPVTNLVVLADMQDESNRALLRDKNDELLKRVDESGVPFMACPIVYGTSKTLDKSLVGIPAACCLVGMDLTDDTMLMSVKYANPILDKAPDWMVDEAMKKTAREIQSWSALAFMTVTLLMLTEGVEQEHTTVGNLNKKRKASGKTSIPDHVYLHIKKVYSSAQGGEGHAYDARKSPRPHWRRGHLRSVRYGAGREKLRTVFIRPRLVALKGDARVDPPTYVVGN